MENLPEALRNIIHAKLFNDGDKEEETYQEAEERGKELNAEARKLKKKFKAQNVDESQCMYSLTHLLLTQTHIIEPHRPSFLSLTYSRKHLRNNARTTDVEDHQTQSFVTVIGNKSVMIGLDDIVMLKKPSVMPSCYGAYENVLITNDVMETYGRKKIIECLRVLDIAHTKFIKAGQQLNWKYELEYMKMYECVRDNQELWFQGVLLIDDHKTFALNFPIAERLTALLGTYCLILRQRGNIKQADLITKTVYSRSLERHLEMAKASERKDVISANRSMRYKYNQIKLNLAYQHHREDEYVPLCRELLKFEIENSFDFDQSLYLMFIGT